MSADVLVVGAGPAGLAVAACLRRQGIDAVIVDRGEAVGDTWAARYERLHLHTPRIQSALPGLRMPRRFGRWVAKDDMAHYLRVYARRHGLAPQFRTEVRRLDRADGRWTATTDTGMLTARQVVVATGYSNTPVQPHWPGQEDFGGSVIHASAYRSPHPYDGQRVLVVGAGNTGAEIAADLAEHGAADVRLSIRTPPNIIPRQFGPLPTTLMAVPMDVLPAALVDPVNRLLQRVTLGDLARYGMPRARAGVVAQARSTGVTPTIDVGLVAALRTASVTPVASLERFDGSEAVLTDGSRFAPDAVIAATGYSTGLTTMIGHLGVLDERGAPIVTGRTSAPGTDGLRFVGLWNPLKGQLFQIGLDARVVARVIRRELRSADLRTS
ncbi:NAD(P)/FAD-dependent oxidoreductase [Microbacterium sp. LMI12-1-1.1]|uniref:flavin-containing monooxygenase n=1 Tax=Microbacterium sp. LMI12-1-1.1 TaxID=3135225 RepID=UPI00341921AA